MGMREEVAKAHFTLGQLLRRVGALDAFVMI